MSALGATGCSELVPSSGTGLVCSSSLPVEDEAKIEVPAFAVPVSAQGGDVSAMATFTVSGLVQYQKYGLASSRIDYTSGATTFPVRRAIVQIMSGLTPIATGLTNDAGNYSISVTTSATSLTVRVLARSTVVNYTADGLGPNNCAGGGWDIRVVNNATNNSASQSSADLRPQYALDSSSITVTGSALTQNMTAAMVFNNTATAPAYSYTERAGAPFALLDTAISAVETACQGRANITFPTLYMNWSRDNTTASGNRYQGNISTSFFTTETTARTANLYILGKVNVDTDELDTHVVAHEFGHFLENKIYRSDSIGGRHSLTDSLDPRLAFGEGFGNAFSGIVHADPYYIDTSDTSQQSGFTIDVSQVPSSNNDRGPWSERSMQYMLYHMAEQRGSFGAIHNVLENFQKTSQASTNGLTFISYYAQQYGQTGDDLSTTWGNAGTLNSPINALCTGSCSAGSPVYSPWDTDNDLGNAYTGTRSYNQLSSTQFPADFWRLYRPLVSGANAGTDHDRISFGGYAQTSDNLNKFGLRRLYSVTATGTTTTVSVSKIYQGTESCSSNDLLDMAVYSKGVMVGLDEATSGSTANCPSVTFCSTPGQTYVVEIAGFGTVGKYDLSVSP